MTGGERSAANRFDRHRFLSLLLPCHRRPYDNWEQVMFDARNKQFDTVRWMGVRGPLLLALHHASCPRAPPRAQVMAAIGSNSERWGIFTVQLEFERGSGSSGDDQPA